MPSGNQQWLEFVNESSYGVTQTTTPTLDWIRLHQDDAFTVVPTKMYHQVRGADSRNRRVVNIPGRQSVGGKLSTYLYSDKGTGGSVNVCDFLLAWATTFVSGDLASYSIKHWDGIRARSYLGCKVSRLHISGAPEQEEGAMKVDVDIIGQRPDPVDPVSFIEPAQNVFAKAPYRIQEASGGITATTTTGVRTITRGFDLTIANRLVPSWDDLDYITDCTWNGRDIDAFFATRFRTKADRDAFEAQTSFTLSALFTKVSPAHTLTLTLNALNYITALDRSLKLGEPTYETLHFANFEDPGSGADFSYVAT